jgi:hypothetical protein
MKSRIAPCLASFFALALAGCQTPHQFAKPDRTWQTHIGQLKYSDAERTVIGDVVVQRRGEQEFQLEFQKAGGVPLLTLREDATTVRAEGLFARGSWQGAPSAAPKHLRSWVWLRMAFRHPKPLAIKAGDQPWTGEAKSAGSRLSSISLYFPEDKKRFVFQFNR